MEPEWELIHQQQPDVQRVQPDIIAQLTMILAINVQMEQQVVQELQNVLVLNVEPEWELIHQQQPDVQDVQLDIIAQLMMILVMHVQVEQQVEPVPQIVFP